MCLYVFELLLHQRVSPSSFTSEGSLDLDTEDHDKRRVACWWMLMLFLISVYIPKDAYLYKKLQVIYSIQILHYNKLCKQKIYCCKSNVASNAIKMFVLSKTSVFYSTTQRLVLVFWN